MARTEAAGATRVRLSRDRVLRAAVDFADDHGLASLSMRKLGEAVGVEAMSLYNHVANKDELLAACHRSASTGKRRCVSGRCPPAQFWRATAGRSV
jgi:AcrR family transcriptional regulator